MDLAAPSLARALASTAIDLAPHSFEKNLDFFFSEVLGSLETSKEGPTIP